MPLDRAFIRPIAHRGLHDVGRGTTENTGPAFEAAIAIRCGIECDIRPAAGGLPVVFHDATLDRLIGIAGNIAELSATQLKELRHKLCGSPILTFAEMLQQVAGRVPILAEVKSDWRPPDERFLAQVAELASAGSATIALMSFDPAYMSMARRLAPGLPRGLIATDFTVQTWWKEHFDAARAYRLSNFLESDTVEPDLYAYDVKHLPRPVTDFVRQVLHRPVFAWTVRTGEEREIAFRSADALIFEGEVPAMPDPTSPPPR